MNSAQHSAVHLEMRDCYMRSDPRFAAWQAGHRDTMDNRDSWWRARGIDHQDYRPA